MKIRILGNSLRLRLSQTEILLLETNGKVKETIKFGLGASQHLNYILQKAAVSEMFAAYNGNNITVLLPTEMADDWAKTDTVSIEKYIVISEEEHLRVLIEKDFKCLKDRVGEDESDLFPNPDGGNVKC